MRFVTLLLSCKEIAIAKDFARSFYHSTWWKKVRESIITRDRGLCQRCLRLNRINPGKIVHHITPLTPENINDPSISLNPENLEYLCKECHEIVHGKAGEGALNGYAPYESRVVFDEYGNVLPK